VRKKMSAYVQCRCNIFLPIFDLQLVESAGADCVHA
jgi:hypothetical protein